MLQLLLNNKNLCLEDSCLGSKRPPPQFTVLAHSVFPCFTYLLSSDGTVIRPRSTWNISCMPQFKCHSSCILLQNLSYLLFWFIWKKALSDSHKSGLSPTLVYASNHGVFVSLAVETKPWSENQNKTYVDNSSAKGKRYLTSYRARSNCWKKCWCYDVINSPKAFSFVFISLGIS